MQAAGVEADENPKLYERFAGEALDILAADLPWLDAVVTGVLPPTEDKGGMVFVTYRVKNALQDTRAKQAAFPALSKAARGMPLRIKVQEMDAGRAQVVGIELRNGDDWDILPAEPGIVVHVNMEHHLTHVAFSKKDFCLLHHSQFPDSAGWAPGSFVRLKVLRDQKRECWKAVYAAPADPPGKLDFVMPFKGILAIKDDGRFGFVGQVYVPRSLMEGVGNAEGMNFEGMAVCQWNNRRNEYGWSAVTLEEVRETSQV